MPRRPTSLQFPLRHRRNTSSAAAEEATQAQADLQDSASPVKTTPFKPLISSATSSDPPYVPPPKSKRRLTFGSSSHAPSKSVTAAAALQTRAELRARVRANWTFPPGDSEAEPHYGEDVSSRVQPDTVYVERELEISAPSRSPSPVPFSTWGAGTGSMPVVPILNGHPPEAINQQAEQPDPSVPPVPPVPAASEPHLLRYDLKDEARPVSGAQEGPYRFEDPEAVGILIKKRRNRWAMDRKEERRINPGFRHFEDRRDAWTGAVRLRRNEAGGLVRHQELEDASDAEADDEGDASYVRPMKRRHIKNDDGAKVSGSFAGSGTESPSGAGTETGTGTGTGTGTDSGVGSSSESSARPSLPSTSEEPGSSVVTLIPRPAPLIAFSHPIRSQITPNAYRSIYSRIIVQGTAPAIPVNLSDIISACVTGWKADGEWPPGATSAALPPATHKLAYPLPAHTTTTGLPTEPTHARGKSDAMAVALLGQAAAEQIREQGLEGHKPPTEKSSKRRTARLSAFIAGIGRDGPGTEGTGPADETLTADGAQEGLSLRNTTTAEVHETGELDHEDAAAMAGLIDGTFSVMGRGVRKMSRALKAVGGAMLDGESGYEAEGDALEDEVPGLVQGGLGGTFDQVEIGHFERREM